MRLFNLLFTLALTLTLVQAQSPITITSTDMPSTGDTIRYSITNDIQGQDPTLTGANYTWDYSTLTYSSQRIDTFFSVTTFPTNYQFAFNNPGLPLYKASYGLRGQDITFPPIVPIPISFTDVFNFIKNSPTNYENVGFGSKINGFAYPTRKIPIDVEYQFPLNYSDTSYSNSEFALNLPSLAYYGQTMERENKVDGWGTLKTPVGTFDVLRVKSILTKVDTLFLDTLGFGFLIPRPEEIEYKWLAKGMRTPVLKIVTTLGVVSTIEYQQIEPVGINELSLINNVLVFPNPTREFIQVIFNAKNAGKLDCSVKDVNGKLIINNDFVTNVGKNVFQIDLSKNKLSNGVYFVEIKMNDQVMTQKIVFSE